MAANISCSTVEIPDISPHITLPASRDGYYVYTVSEKEGRIPAEQWAAILETTPHIILFSKDWSKLRNTIVKNCLVNKCKQAVGIVDGMFQALDAGLGKVKIKK